jgi:hypothetical protein
VDATERYEYGPVYVRRTPWRTRLIVWPGMWFRTWPFPYLFERWQASADVVRGQEVTFTSDFHGFFRRSSADEWVAEARDE